MAGTHWDNDDPRLDLAVVLFIANTFDADSSRHEANIALAAPELTGQEGR